MKDFTEGNIARQVIDFTLPVMLGNVLMTVYGIINMIWVGRLLGHKAVAAVSASLPILMLMPSFLIGLGMAATVLIAQAYGRRDTELLKKILSNSFISSMLFCLLISLGAVLFRRELLDLVHAPQEIYGMALSYMTIMLATMVFQFFINWMAGMLRGLGDASTVLRILFLLTVFNIIFVPLFIHGFGPLPAMGIDGAAWGAAAAAVAASIIGYIYLLQYNPYVDMKNWDYSLDWHIIREVFVIGVPASLQMIVVSLAGVIIIALVNRYGTIVTAGFGIGMQIDMLAIIPFISIGMASTTIAGQNLGAHRMDRVLETLRISVYFGMMIAVVCTFVLFMFPHYIGAIFLKPSAESARVLDVVRGYYRWIAFIYPAFAVIFAIQGVLRSAGDTIALLLLSFVAMFLLRIPLAYALAGPAGFGPGGIWMAILASSVLAVFFNWLYYKKGPWKEKRILRKKDASE